LNSQFLFGRIWRSDE